MHDNLVNSNAILHIWKLQPLIIKNTKLFNSLYRQEHTKIWFHFLFIRKTKISPSRFLSTKIIVAFVCLLFSVFFFVVVESFVPNWNVKAEFSVERISISLYLLEVKQQKLNILTKAALFHSFNEYRWVYSIQHTAANLVGEASNIVCKCN